MAVILLAGLYPAFIQSAFRLEIDCTPSAINELSGENILNISPNPVAGHFKFSIHSSEAGSIEIYDAVGKKVYEAEIESAGSGIELDASNVLGKAGLYIAVLKGEKTISRKIVYLSQ